MQIKKIILTTTFNLLTLSLFADTSATATQLTLKDCYLKAVKRSYTLLNEIEVSKQANEKYLQAWQNVMPSLSIIGSDNEGGNFGNSFAGSNFGAISVTFSQPLFRGFKNTALINQTKDLIFARHNAQKWAYYQLYLDMAQVYYNLASIRKQVEYLKNQVRLYDERIKEISAWVQIGKSRASDLSSVKALRAILPLPRSSTSPIRCPMRINF